MSSSQQARPYFLSTVFAAFRQPPTATQLSTPQSSASKSSSSQQQSRSLASSSQPRAASTSPRPSHAQPTRQTSSVAQVSLSPRAGQNGAIPIPSSSSNRRRGSDSSSEGFREAVQPNGPWYIGGRTAGGEEKFFKLGVVRRVRSIDRLSLDRLSL